MCVAFPLRSQKASFAKCKHFPCGRKRGFVAKCTAVLVSFLGVGSPPWLRGHVAPLLARCARPCVCYRRICVLVITPPAVVVLGHFVARTPLPWGVYAVALRTPRLSPLLWSRGARPPSGGFLLFNNIETTMIFLYGIY